MGFEKKQLMNAAGVMNGMGFEKEQLMKAAGVMVTSASTLESCRHATAWSHAMLPDRKRLILMSAVWSPQFFVASYEAWLERHAVICDLFPAGVRSTVA